MKYPHQFYVPVSMTTPSESSFTKGFVASACLSAFQEVADPVSTANLKRVLRHSLQGGTALAAGTHASMALRCCDFSGALFAAATGAVGVLLIENLLRDAAQPQEEKHHE
ncbi:hypothetical protein [Methylobacter sp.]|uniref:hypothetical protein n=1 Tax=Methylobacter sp. TaxID=2051955 RepID=UPI002FDCFAEB